MPHTPLFSHRTQAGEELAQVIHKTLNQQANESGIKPAPIVYALPRGGLEVAAPVAQLLSCPLTILVAKKISHPENPELAIGAVTACGNVLWAQPRRMYQRQNLEWQKTALNKAINQAKSLEAELSFACPQVNAEGATVIIVDDGIATGMTMAVAAAATKRHSPRQVWLCAPVAPLKLLPWLRQWGDRTIVLATPEPFASVSNFYLEFPQVETSEALMYLQQ
ncbi:MAG: phosphoribosyltransferase [Fischerella sp.]|jgi:predicted phosphoribosyltransferase|uniref:phosphoribosyltransferase n=1 Tax=Fischerella sp. TaxID=1191 RepID=UPI0017C335C5|nr:phosphoribosyltransferase family protein [Fischerella sp.]NWF58144.1 phosphoribosyltransferase [Fischerella sp.]